MSLFQCPENECFCGYGNALTFAFSTRFGQRQHLMDGPKDVRFYINEKAYKPID